MDTNSNSCQEVTCNILSKKERSVLSNEEGLGKLREGKEYDQNIFYEKGIFSGRAQGRMLGSHSKEEIKIDI